VALYTPEIAPLVTEGGVLVPAGCSYGVDIPLQPREGESYLSRLVPASGEVASIIGADSVHYLSAERMFAALGTEPSRSCHRCMRGPKPFSHG
ncbi:MAG TPA: hypothetical protein VJB16_07600, partial [archaeon]|nr:hypothetical protein [archaeon]